MTSRSSTYRKFSPLRSSPPPMEEYFFSHKAGFLPPFPRRNGFRFASERIIARPFFSPSFLTPPRIIPPPWALLPPPSVVFLLSLRGSLFEGSHRPALAFPLTIFLFLFPFISCAASRRAPRFEEINAQKLPAGRVRLFGARVSGKDFITRHFEASNRQELKKKLGHDDISVLRTSDILEQPVSPLPIDCQTHTLFL